MTGKKEIRVSSRNGRGYFVENKAIQEIKEIKKDVKEVKEILNSKKEKDVVFSAKRNSVIINLNVHKEKITVLLNNRRELSIPIDFCEMRSGEC